MHKQYLTDTKTRVKKKVELTRSVRKTGGGKAEIPDLNVEDEKLLAVMEGKLLSREIGK